MPTNSLAEDLWSLQELTILAFDSREVQIESDEDNRGIRLAFDSWDSIAEQEIEATLANTGIEYRLFPYRQSRMTVELFSKNASLKFNMKRRHHTIQIIVGNARPGLEALQVLLDTETEAPLDDTIMALLKNGELAEARKHLYLQKTEDGAQAELIKSRITIIEAALRGGKANECNEVKKDYQNKYIREAMYLLSWCYFSKGNIQKAEETLSLMATNIEDPVIQKRLDKKRRQILIHSILNYSRENASAQVGNAFSQFAADFLSEFFSINILEVINGHLTRLGLGGVVSKYADEIMSKLSNEKLKLAAPALAETYLNAGQYVQAQDAASYFLQRRLKPWAHGRLLRTKGYVHLQEGNWIESISNFEAAKKHVELTAKDEIALAEAYIRAEQTPTMEIIPWENPTSPIETIQNRWIQRLHTEKTLLSGKTLPKSKLKQLPDHTLYNGLKFARSSNNTKSESRILDILSKRDSSWGHLATLDLQIQKMKKLLQSKFIKGNQQ